MILTLFHISCKPEETFSPISVQWWKSLHVAKELSIPGYICWASTCFPLGLDNKTIVGTTNPSRFSDSSNSVLWHLQSQNTADPKKSHSVPIRVWFSWSSANQPDKPGFLDATLIGCVWLAEPQVSDSYLHTCVCHCKKLSLHRYEQNYSVVPLIREKTVTSQSRRSIWQTMMQA